MECTVPSATASRHPSRFKNITSLTDYTVIIVEPMVAAELLTAPEIEIVQKYMESGFFAMILRKDTLRGALINGHD
uniref:Uncharacterized protein n=1 Tax=Moniliophthora roreri TaxID=221103 RepID=A0A0W0FCX8_MONRR